MLTDGQFLVLQAAQRVSGVSKGSVPGSMWRNLDQLERRGLIERRGFGDYFATGSGVKLYENEQAGKDVRLP